MVYVEPLCAQLKKAPVFFVWYSRTPCVVVFASAPASRLGVDTIPTFVFAVILFPCHPAANIPCARERVFQCSLDFSLRLSHSCTVLG